MPESRFEIIDAARYPDLLHAGDAVISTVWPEFMLNDPVANRHWDGLYTLFPAYQFALVDPATDRIAAVGNSLPLVWVGAPADLPDAGWDWALEKGFADQTAGLAPTTQCALSISIAAEYQGQGLSQRVVSAMKDIGRVHGLDSLLAPVRPNLKSRYPLIPMERYITWTNDDGLPFDAWLRVHVRLGAPIVKVCPQSMTITGSVAAWERWTGLRLPESGVYTIPHGLVPLEIDLEADRGTYIEPNVWVRHPLTESSN